MIFSADDEDNCQSRASEGALSWSIWPFGAKAEYLERTLPPRQATFFVLSLSHVSLFAKVAGLSAEKVMGNLQSIELSLVSIVSNHRDRRAQYHFSRATLRVSAKC